MRKHPLANCENCIFKDAPFVPTQNPQPRTKLAVIGEAPGAYEAEKGIPFTGPSGRLLNEVLAHHGYERADVMVTNVCLCRPKDNSDPPKSAIEACAPRLKAELAASGVEKILAVGGTAASTLIDPKKKISSLRVGPPKPYLHDPQVQVVATWHPAYCLRAPDSFPSFVADTAKLRGRTNASWSEPNYRVFNSGSDVREAIRRLQDATQDLVIDIECGIDKDTSFAHPDHYDLLCVGIAYAPGQAVVFPGDSFSDSIIQNEFRHLLRTKRLIAHNGKFDLAALYPIFGELELTEDTMLMSYALDERPGLHGLKKLAIENLNAPDWEAAIKKFVPRGKSYAAVPKPILYKYNAYDVVATWALWKMFQERMGERENKLHAFLIRASNAIRHLERAGITFDVDYSIELQDLLEDELAKLEVEIEHTTGRVLNPRSPMQIQRYLRDKGLNVDSTDVDTIEPLAARLPDGELKTFINQLLLHRRRAKLNGTYVKGFQKRIYQDKIFTTYTLHGTTSGRLASKNPNMQNIVRDKRIKHQFTVSQPKNILVQLDYKQAEGRIITTLAQDEYLAGIFRDSTRDIFNELTEQVYGSGKWSKEERVKIKSVFYGLSYGRGAESIGVELGISSAEARELLFNFKALIPATVGWQAAVTHRVLAGEDLYTPFGRKRSFWLITQQNRHEVINEALSFLPQSIASDICLTALIELQSKLAGLATTRLTIHDAMIFECAEADQEEVIAIASKEMVDAGLAFTDYVPFVVDVSVGKRWSEL